MGICPFCREKFSALGSHWQQNPDCEYPELTQEQKEIITGVLMGDGYINRQKNAKPRFCVGNTNKEYLEHLNRNLKPYSNDVSLGRTAEEVAENFQTSGFSKNIEEENCNDFYRLSTNTSPVFEEFAEWYRSGEKVFPGEIDLTPTTLKHWFVCDGYANKRGRSYYIGIQMANERGNENKIERIFENGPGIGVSYWNSRTQGDGTDYLCAEFAVDDSSALIEYMGDAPPGFEYKWPDD
jgi:hypothetical protein